MTRPPDAYRPRVTAKLDARYRAFLARGFPVRFGNAVETLQCRNEADRIAWLTLMGICKEAVDAAAGATPMAVPFRTTSNRFYIVSNAAALGILRNLRTWAAAAQINHWRLKDAVRDAPTRQALFDLDLDKGWP